MSYRCAWCGEDTEEYVLVTWPNTSMHAYCSLLHWKEHAFANGWAAELSRPIYLG